MTTETSNGHVEEPPVILSAEGLRKSYGTHQALKNLSFTLRAGRVLGFLGPNGAGKTTSIRILTTILPPSSGRFVVDGVTSDHPVQIRRRIGVLPEGLGFPRQLTGARYLAYYGQLFGSSSHEARSTAEGLLQEVGLQNRGHSPIGSYSHGMRQRLGIARALVNDPAVLFFDEPTLGLDPRGQRELLTMVRGIARDRGKGVVLSSHLLAEIEGVCDDVVIMNAGEVVARGTVAEVIGQASQRSGVALRVRVPVGEVPAACGLIAGLPRVQAARPDDSTGWIGVELRQLNGDAAADPRLVNMMLEPLLRADVPILALDAGSGRLEDVFLQLTAEAIR